MPHTAEPTEVTLHPVDQGSHRELIAGWLAQPHVHRWWGAPEAALAHLDATPPNQHALIALNDALVGYLRWQPVVPEDLAAVGLSDIPQDAVDADILIGDVAWIGRGIGPRALQLLLARLSATGKFSMLGLCTSASNHAAIRAFEKAGCPRLRQYDDPVYGRCWVMAATLPVGPERAV